MNNPLAFVQAMRNPQEFMQKIMQNQQAMQNPMVRNAFDMLQKGDNKGLEEMARNLCNERGINADDTMKQLKSMFGM